MVVAGTPTLAVGFLFGESAGFVWLLFVGPVLLGGLIAFVSAARSELLGLAVVTFVALGVAGLIALGPDGRAEGGAFLVFWTVGAEVAGMYVVAGLRHVARRKPWVAWRSSRVRRRRLVALGALVVLLVVAGVIALGVSGRSAGFDSHSHRRASEREAARLIREAKRLDLKGRITFATPSDGAPFRVLVMTMNADGSDLQRITPDAPVDVDGLAGTPDGSHIAFWHGSYIYSMDGDGRGVRRISRLASGSDPAWSPADKRVAFGRKSSCEEVNGQVATPCQQSGDGIYVANVNGRSARMIATTDDGHDAPTWSPDGKRIAFTTLASGSGALWVVRSDGARRKQLTTGEIGDQEPAWSPDGRLIASNCGPVDGGSLCVVHADGSHRRKLVSLAVTSLTWSPDGQWILFLAGGNNQESKDGLWVIQRDGAKLTQILPAERYIPGFGWVIPDVVFTQLVWTRS